jgi:hypothetical protein
VAFSKSLKKEGYAAFAPRAGDRVTVG